MEGASAVRLRGMLRREVTVKVVAGASMVVGGNPPLFGAAPKPHEMGQAYAKVCRFLPHASNSSGQGTWNQFVGRRRSISYPVSLKFKLFVLSCSKRNVVQAPAAFNTIPNRTWFCS